MRYQVRHLTSYAYEDSVSVSHHIVRLRPRPTPNQICRESRISITPRPSSSATHLDYFRNSVTLFTMVEPHESLTVESSADVDVKTPGPSDFSSSAHWEHVRDSLCNPRAPGALDACQFVFDSRRVAAQAVLADYASESFQPNRPVLEASLDLTRRIFQDFRFDSKATEVSTPVETFFEKRRGVCQDFAHLQIACMRSLGLAARYVSGYLRTIPPPGRPRLAGADASHAWVSVWCPGAGWVDYDPTNNCVPGDGHITVAWGRDYGDISPVYGVLVGGARHKLDVGVDVMPVE